MPRLDSILPLRLVCTSLGLGLAAGCSGTGRLPLPSLVLGLVARRAPAPASGSAPGGTHVAAHVALVFVPRSIAPASIDDGPPSGENGLARGGAPFDVSHASCRSAELCAMERRAAALAIARWLGGGTLEATP